MNMKKAIAATVCAGMVVVGSVAGTMAYFTDTTDQYINTFTVGQVDINLTETAAGNETTGLKGGTAVYAPTDSTKVVGYNYHLMPGSTYDKNVDVTVASDSEDCYVFVEVTNGLGDTEVAETAGDTIAAQMEANGWELVSGNVYAYTVDGGVVNANTSLPVFDTFEISADADEAALKALVPAEGTASTITVKAYAVQADGFDNATQAWNETFGA